MFFSVLEGGYRRGCFLVLFLGGGPDSPKTPTTAERIPKVNVEKRILTFSRDVALYHFIGRVIDLISSKRSDY